MEEWIQDYMDGYGKSVPNVFDKEAFANYITERVQHSIPNFKQMKSPDHGQEFSAFNNRHSKETDLTHHGEKRESKIMDIQSNVFETHDYVIVRIAFQSEYNFFEKRLLVNCYKLILQDKRRQQLVIDIKLPHPVLPKTTKYLIKNGILEVQIKKKTPDPWAVFDIEDYGDHF